MKQENERCPIEIAISVVGTKWKVQILRDLVRSEKSGLRFSDFKGTIAGISDKMLSQSLKKLERDHLVDRKLVDAAPPRAEYSLTETGHSLIPVLSALFDWGAEYRSKFIQEATEGVQ